MQKFQPVVSIPADSSEMSAKVASQECFDAPKSQMASCKSVAMLSIALSVGATGALWSIDASPVVAETVFPQYSAAKVNSVPSFYVPATQEPDERTIVTNVKSREKEAPVSSVRKIEPETTTTNDKSFTNDDRVESLNAQNNNNLESLTEKLEKETASFKQNEDLALDKLKDNLIKLRLQYDRNNIASDVIPSETQTKELQEPTIIAQTFPTSESENANNNSLALTEDKTGNGLDSEQPIVIQVPSPESETNSNTNDDSVNSLTTETTTASNTQKNTTDSPEVYRVRVGDTLASIARRYGLSREELMSANGIEDPNGISIGQSLIVPVRSVGATKSSNITEVDRPSQLSIDNTTDNDNISVRNNIVSESNKNKVSENNGNNTVLSLNPTNTATDLSQDDSHLQKLTNDIQKIRQNYQPETQNVNTPVALNQEDPIEIEVPAPENTTETSTQIATHSGDGSQYNPDVNPPLGTQVEPDLPPLSNPENYLPESQTTSKSFIWPSKGVLTSGYGRRWGRMHKGIDIGAPIGTPIVAVANGEVITAGWNSGGFGNLVKIEHPDGTITLYAHNNKILVRKGQIVQQGEQISELGNTGRSTGPHLHFEIHQNGKNAVNPLAYLPKKK
jgi:murein DD-endopeptidase MepM/ murein hydrolase activator NlpD